MGRIGGLTALLATVALAWFEPFSCRAQSTALPQSPAPAVQKRPATTAPIGELKAPKAAGLRTHVPPPRPWPTVSSTASPHGRLPERPAPGSPAVDPAVTRGARNTPPVQPPSSEPPGPPPASLDQMAVD